MSEPHPDPKQEDRHLQVRAIPSSELFQGERMIIITHSGEQYRLAITRNDKLILQK